MRKKRPFLSPLELLAIVLCLLYTLFLGQIARTGDGSFWLLAVIPTLAALSLFYGARRVAFVFQYIFAVLWFLVCLLLLGILVTCVGKEAPGFWQMIAWTVGSFLMALLHSFLARHIKSREDE